MTSDEPFRGSEAVKAGTLRKHQLRSHFRAVFPDIYVRRDQLGAPPACGGLRLRDRAVAAWLWSQRQGVLAGLTAAAWHGSNWVDEDLPVELVWSNVRSPRGLRTYDIRLQNGEVCVVAGIPVTTPERTAFDIGRRKAMGVAIAHLDALMRATGAKVDDVLQLADRHRGARGLRLLERALELVDPGSQSPKETWLRLLLIKAGLPRPTTQIPVMIAGGARAYYLDMGWEDPMVAVEYDGEHHRIDRLQYTKDIRRSEDLERLGWIVIRVTVSDRPAGIIARVRDALAFREGIEPAHRSPIARQVTR